MRQWLFVLGGLLVWTGHFFGIYIAGSLFPGEASAVWLTLALTAAALVGVAAIAKAAWRRWRQDDADDLRPWLSGLALLGAALSATAILYQGLAAIIT